MLKIIVISLADSEHRRSAITKQFEAQGLDVEIFDAIDGRARFPSDHEALVNRAGAARHLGKIMTDTELCCALSQPLYAGKLPMIPKFQKPLSLRMMQY